MFCAPCRQVPAAEVSGLGISLLPSHIFAFLTFPPNTSFHHLLSIIMHTWRPQSLSHCYLYFFSMSILIFTFFFFIASKTEEIYLMSTVLLQTHFSLFSLRNELSLLTVFCGQFSHWCFLPLANYSK